MVYLEDNIIKRLSASFELPILMSREVSELTIKGYRYEVNWTLKRKHIAHLTIVLNSWNWQYIEESFCKWNIFYRWFYWILEPAAGVGLFVNENKKGFMCFKQETLGAYVVGNGHSYPGSIPSQGSITWCWDLWERYDFNYSHSGDG